MLRKRRLVLSDDDKYDRSSFPPSSGYTPASVWYQPWSKKPGLTPFSIRKQLTNGEPTDFYSLLVIHHLFEDVTNQTNLFAQQLPRTQVL